MAIDAIADHALVVGRVRGHPPGIDLGQHFMAFAAKLICAGERETQMGKADEKHGGERTQNKSKRQLPMRNRPTQDTHDSPIAIVFFRVKPHFRFLKTT